MLRTPRYRTYLRAFVTQPKHCEGRVLLKRSANSLGVRWRDSNATNVIVD